jgi:pantoate--beta-alanine ligase
MGALHAGHAALVRRAAAAGPRPVVVSIFVNPTQFAAGEDFLRYPRTFDADLALCAASGGEVAFAPTVEEMYPPSGEIAVPPLPPVATEPGLEDAARPTHFAGVCQVVARLFDLVMPRIAVFGEKDYQQLLVIGELVRQETDRWSGLQIVPHETVREADGLAMSSRNRYLSPADRARALGLSRALKAATSDDQRQEACGAEAAMRRTLAEHGLTVDYAVVRDAATLRPLATGDRGRAARALVAARIGATRLIDNMAMPAG